MLSDMYVAAHTCVPAADTWRRVLRAWSVVTKILHTVEEHDGHMSIEDELPDLREAFRGPLPFLVTILKIL